MDLEEGFRDVVEEGVVAIHLFEEFHVLTAKALLREFEELVGGCGVVEDDLEDFAGEEVGEAGGGLLCNAGCLRCVPD